MTEQQVRDMPDVQALRTDWVHESAANPRVISDRAVDMVLASLIRFGWKQPVVVNSDGELIVGHTRHRAAVKGGLEHVPGVIADDLDVDEASAYRIVDNRTRDFTTWDLPGLARELEHLADDFSDVLALADWEAVTAHYDEIMEGADLDLPPDVKDALDGGFTITVFFHSKEQALAAEQTIIDLPGAFDVRHDL